MVALPVYSMARSQPLHRVAVTAVTIPIGMVNCGDERQLPWGVDSVTRSNCKAYRPDGRRPSKVKPDKLDAGRSRQTTA